jgi:WD40 repeat protein
MGRVASLAFSPDGSLLASCGGSFADDPLVWDPVERGGLSVTGPGRLKVWEVDPGSLKHDLVGHTEQANAVAFSHDGNWLASAGNWTDSNGSGTGVIVWNPQTGQRRSTIETDASGGARHVAFSPNDKTVAICTLHFDIDNDTREGALMLVHALSGVVEWKRAVGEWARPARFSPDGQAVAVLCGGTSIKLIQASTGVEKREIRSADSPRGGKWNDFVFGSHGRLLAIGGVDAERNGKVELWNLDGQGASDASPRPEGGN